MTDEHNLTGGEPADDQGGGELAAADVAALDAESAEAPPLDIAASGTSSIDRNALDGAAAEEARHFRGSSLLVAGRFVGLALDFVTQVLIVRALARTDYGAFAFALAVASLAATVGLLGLDKTISRFVPIYEQTGDQRRLAGSLVVAAGSVAFLGVAMIIGMVGLESVIGRELVENELARRLLLILFLLAPISALDSLLLSCFAIFGSAKSIALRRHIVGPLLQLAVVAAVLVARQPPEVLAVGYVVAGAAGVTLFAVRLARLLRERGILDQIRRRDVILPVRALFRFSLPLLSSDMVFLLRTSAVIILLQYLTTSSEVAAYGAVLPLAKQNLLVYQSFSFLFVPAAARFFARGEGERLHDLYWRTSAWIAVATFPALALTLGLAEPLTTLLFGPGYADAGAVLAILAVGHYVSAALGFNALTLRVQGEVRLIVAVDLVSAVLNVAVSVILIVRLGALGAAIATSTTLILQNLLYQAGLVRTPIGWPDRRQLGLYGMLLGVAVALFALQQVLQPPLVVGITLAAAASILVIGLNRATLKLDVYFPELRRVPLLASLLRSDRVV